MVQQQLFGLVVDRKW